MNKLWRIMIGCLALTIAGYNVYYRIERFKTNVEEIAGDKYFYEEENVDAVYVDSYEFDGKTIDFYFDDYYGIRGSYIIVDGKQKNLFSQQTDMRSQDLSTILHIQTLNVDREDYYENGVLKQPAKVIENERVKVKLYEFDTDSEVIYMEPDVEMYSVYRCQKLNMTCDMDMELDLDALQTMINSWDNRMNDFVDQPKIEDRQFGVYANFTEYKYLSNHQRRYEFETLVNEDGSGYVQITGTGQNINPTYQLTKEQMDEFNVFIGNK